MTHECCNYVKNYCAKSDAGNHQADGCGGTAMETIEQLCELKVPKVVECVGDCSDYGCDPVFESPCPLIGAKSTTFEHCSGCPTTGLPDEDGKTYQCFPGAYGFQDYRCCGLHPECADETEELECQGADLSDVMAKRCAWVTHGSCRALKQQQEIEYIFGTVADPENAGASLPNVARRQLV